MRSITVFVISFLFIVTLSCIHGLTILGNNLSSPAVNFLYQDNPGIIYFVDGIAMTADKVDKLNPDKIEHMEFIQDKEQIRKYTDKDVDTVVLITMKKEEGTEEEEKGIKD